MRFLEGELKTRRSATSCQNAYYDGPSWCKMLVSTTHQSLDLHTIAARRYNGGCSLDRWSEARLTEWLASETFKTCKMTPPVLYSEMPEQTRQCWLCSLISTIPSRISTEMKGFLFSLSFWVHTLHYDALLCCDFLWEKNTLRKKLTLTLKLKIHCHCPRVIACVDCVISCRGFSNFHLTLSYIQRIVSERVWPLTSGKFLEFFFSRACEQTQVRVFVVWCFIYKARLLFYLKAIV